jgi:hypothetical protein
MIRVLLALVPLNDLRKKAFSGGNPAVDKSVDETPPRGAMKSP